MSSEYAPADDHAFGDNLLTRFDNLPLHLLGRTTGSVTVKTLKERDELSAPYTPCCLIA